jgi:hypothetical protein
MSGLQLMTTRSTSGCHQDLHFKTKEREQVIDNNASTANDILLHQLPIYTRM